MPPNLKERPQGPRGQPHRALRQLGLLLHPAAEGRHQPGAAGGPDLGRRRGTRQDAGKVSLKVRPGFVYRVV